MSLNKAKLKTDLTALFDGTINSEGNETAAKTAFIDGLTDIIDSYVRSIQVNYTSGLTATNGLVNGTFIHTIS